MHYKRYFEGIIYFMNRNISILWINPSFLDYRVPLYTKLYDKTNGNFQLIFSCSRIPPRVINKVIQSLGRNAIGLRNEKLLHIFENKSDFANTKISIPYQPNLFTSLLKIKADIIITEGFFQWTPFAILKSLLQRIPILIAYERTEHTERNSPFWRTFYRKLITKFVNGFIANGVLTKEYLVKKLNVKDSKIFVGGMSADSDNLKAKIATIDSSKKKEIIERLGITNNNPIFLYVGQVIQRKGVDYLIKAWKEYNSKGNGFLLIVGDGFQKQDLENYIEINSIKNIKMCDNISYDNIYEYYSIADVFIMPTLEDNWSLVVPEAMACGLPIACSIYNGCYPELIHEEVNGKLFDPLNIDSIVTTLKFFESHYDKLNLMGKASIEIESSFCPEKIASNIYNACLKIKAKKTKNEFLLQ